MREYSKRDDWKIIVNVKQEMTRRWVDINKLKIDCTRGVVDIQGELDFTGQGKSAMDSILSISNALKKLDTFLKSIGIVRDVKWKLLGWSRQGRVWTYKPTAEIRKKDEAKGIKQ